MKRYRLWTAALLTAALAAGVSGCGNTAQTEDDAEAVGASSAEKAAEAAETSSTEEAETASANSASEEVPSSTQEVFAMDTYMTITGYGEKAEEAVQAAVDEIQRLDALLSVGNAESEIAEINAQGAGTVSEDTAAMIRKALEIGGTTEGKFDISIYPLMVEWGFTSGDFKVPDEQTIQNLLADVDYEKVQLDENTMTVTLGDNQGIDLGGIAKGFTSDRIMEIFEEYDLVSGVVSLGGNVECYGTKTDGSNWRCGIQDPNNADDGTSILGVYSGHDCAVITSGAYERYFEDEETGKKYHHIIDPDTGYPAESGLTSVSIISESGVLADGLSTSMFILGLDDAISYWREYGDDFDMVLMTEDDQLYVTEGIADDFEGYYPVTVVTEE